MTLLSLKAKTGIGIIASFLLTTSPEGTGFYSLQKNEGNTDSPPYFSAIPTQISNPHHIILSA